MTCCGIQPWQRGTDRTRSALLGGTFAVNTVPSFRDASCLPSMQRPASGETKCGYELIFSAIAYGFLGSAAFVRESPIGSAVLTAKLLTSQRCQCRQQKDQGLRWRMAAGH